MQVENNTLRMELSALKQRNQKLDEDLKRMRQQMEVLRNANDHSLEIGELQRKIKGSFFNPTAE